MNEEVKNKKRNKINTEIFISLGTSIHNEFYDYSLVEYINTKSKVCIICPLHGEFKSTYEHHIVRKQKCSRCSNKYKLSTDEWIKLAKEIHNYKYDYSQVKYLNNTAKVSIICKKHGLFNQSPKSHLKGIGCSKCSGYLITQDDFLKRSKESHGKKYNYDLAIYKNCSTKVIIGCNIHGNFEQLPDLHTNGFGCPYCAGVKSNLYLFIKKSKQIHGDKYDYSKVSYVGSKNSIVVNCKEHGDFSQKMYCHLQGSGCPKCGFSDGVYNMTSLKQNYDKWIKITAVLYYIKFNGNGEEFFKIGVTKTSIKDRIRTIPYTPIEIKKIDTNLVDAIKIEHELYEENKPNKYVPLIKFGGHTECFKKVNLLKYDILCQ